MLFKEVDRFSEVSTPIVKSSTGKLDSKIREKLEPRETMDLQRVAVSNSSFFSTSKSLASLTVALIRETYSYRIVFSLVTFYFLTQIFFLQLGCRA